MLFMSSINKEMFNMTLNDKLIIDHEDRESPCGCIYLNGLYMIQNNK